MSNNFKNISRMKNLQKIKSVKGYTEYIELYNKQLDFLQNPKTYQDIIKCDPNTVIILHPPVSIYANGVDGLMLSHDQIKQKTGEILYHSPQLVLAAGSNITERFNIKFPEYIMLKRGTEATGSFFFDNIGVISFDGHSILCSITEENASRLTRVPDEVVINDTEIN